MKLTRAVIDNPIMGYVIILTVMTFGIVMLTKLPIQLTPEIVKPEITITTTWRAAAPEEIESEIIEPQEDVLKSVPGVVSMLSDASRGQGSITLTFELGYSIERGLIEVLNRLNRVTNYPVDADEPSLSTVGETARPIAWFVIKRLPGNNKDIAGYKRYIEEVVQSQFERVWGIARSEVYGGKEQELHIAIDPYKAAGLGVNLPEIISKVAGREDISGGTGDIGKRRYTIRFEGAFDVNNFSEMILEWRDGKPVRLRDIAEVQMGYEDHNTFVINNGENSVAVNAYRESGVNVMETMTQLQGVATALAEGPLKRAGLSMRQVYDETIYVEKSIFMLLTNLLFGVILAGAVLWWFTRRIQTSLIVAMSIPLSLFVTLIVLQITGRTLNVISLAALALAVGMVLDASIIAIENILRLREEGRSLREAAIEGSDQIKTALIASAATTVAIFLPIVLLEGEAGQLFADLAIGLSTAIIASLFAALIIVPALSNKWLHRGGSATLFDSTWDRITEGVMNLIGNKSRRWKLITALFVIPIVLTGLLLPKADYLPAGNRNLVFAYLLTPPGMNIDTMEKEMGTVIKRKLQPHVSGEKLPAIRHYFFVAFGSGAFMGATAKIPSQIQQLVPVIGNVFRDFPDTFAFARTASLFSRGNTRTIEVNLQARDTEALLRVAYMGYGLIMREVPGARVNPKPGLELAEAQLSLVPREDRIIETGWDYATMGLLTRAMGDGVLITDYFDGDKKIDIIGRISGWRTLEELAAIPLTTPLAGVVPFGELVDIRRTAGPERIRRIERRRTVTLEVIAPPTLPLEVTAQLIREKVAPILRDQLPEDGAITYTGSADQLEVALSGMGGAFILAIFILFLLMAVLFRSFLDSLLIVIALPLATVGGVLLLKVINLFVFQPMDLLTMIGFVILLGLVVNNAILLVHQTRQAERNGCIRRDAVRQALRLRMRPIFMSTLTSLFGMLPLLLAFGAGAELYRGLAGVIVGGLLVSTIFTLILLPCLLLIGEDKVVANKLADI